MWQCLCSQHITEENPLAHSFKATATASLQLPKITAIAHRVFFTSAFKASQSQQNTVTFENVSSTEAALIPHGCKPQNDLVNSNAQAHAYYSAHRHSLTPC